MTSKITPGQRTAGTLKTFPDFPPRDDMQNPLYLHDDGHQPALRLHLGNEETTLVLSEVPVGRYPGQVEGSRRPDLLIAFGIDRQKVVDQKGYAIDEQGKPPDFVLEVASESTGVADYTSKRDDYARFGATEYWRFDPSRSEFHDAPLAGDRLVAGAYREITIHQVDENRLWGHSDVLNLDLCWEYERLRWWDPVAERYLPTHEEEAAGRVTAEIRADSAEARAEDEREAREAAESRVRELETELERRQRP